jgi:hypothetical protein
VRWRKRRDPDPYVLTDEQEAEASGQLVAQIKEQVMRGVYYGRLADGTRWEADLTDYQVEAARVDWTWRR